ncbi:MAG: DNA polymerase III subunit delta [Patescibacteria group bacterium]
MIYFLYGLDSYGSKQKLSEIIDGYKKVRQSGLSLAYFDASQKSFQEFSDIFKTYSMFEDKKLIILKNVFLNKEFQEDFLKELKKLESLSDIIVIYESEKPDQRLKIFKDLLKNCQCQAFELLDSRNLKIWAQKEFEKHGQKINADALDLLLNYTGNDLWRAYNEINKLANYKKGQAVKKEDVEMQVRPRIEADIFKTIDSLAGKNKKEAFKFLQKHLDAGDNPLYLLSMITYQFRNLLLVKELAQKGFMYASIVKKSGLHPFVVKKSYFLCNQFTFEELKRIYLKIFQMDIDIKTGKIEAETAINLLVSQI